VTIIGDGHVEIYELDTTHHVTTRHNVTRRVELKLNWQQKLCITYIFNGVSRTACWNAIR